MAEICAECGADSFKIKDYDKIVKEKIEIGYRFKRLHADHGLEKAQWALREISLTESMKYLQNKTLKQAKAIRTLEAKLKRLGKQPYKDEGVGALEPGMIILDNTTVVTRVEYNSSGVVVITGELVRENKNAPI